MRKLKKGAALAPILKIVGSLKNYAPNGKSMNRGNNNR